MKSARSSPPGGRPPLRHGPVWLESPWAPLVLVGLGFTLRLLHLFEASRLPIFDRPSVDSALYVEMARHLALSFDHPEAFFKPPLYPYLLGAWWRIVGENPLLLRLPGVFLGSATCFLVWIVGRRLFGARVGFLAGALYALHRMVIHFETELLETGVVTFLHLASFWLVERAGREDARRAHVFLAGLALGIGCVARPTLLPFAGTALVWLGKRRLVPALLGLVLALAPVTIHNAVHGGDFVLISSNLGLNFYLGNNPRSNGRFAAAPEIPGDPGAARTTAHELAEQASGQPLNPGQVSRYWLLRGLDYGIQNPGRALELLGRKLFFVWSSAEISDNEDLAGLSRHLRIHRILPVGMWLLAPLGLVGLLAGPRGRRDVLLARLFVVTQILSVLPFFVVARFRIPWIPLLACFAAWTALEIVSRVRQRPGLAARLVSGTALAGLLTNWPAFAVRAPVDFDLDYKIGYAYQERGEIDLALASYRRVVARNPQNALARNAIGLLIAKTGGDLNEAAGWIESAIPLDPARSAHYYESLAEVHLLRRAPDAALRACDTGLAASPGPSTRALLFLRRAQSQRALGRVGAEIQSLRSALAGGLDPEKTHAAQKRLAEVTEQNALPIERP